jgi:hypothetical protein
VTVVNDDESEEAGIAVAFAAALAEGNWARAAGMVSPELRLTEKELEALFAQTMHVPARRRRTESS